MNISSGISALVRLLQSHLSRKLKYEVIPRDVGDGMSAYYIDNVQLHLGLPVPANNLSIPLSHIYIAFEGLPISSEDIYALAALQTLLAISFHPLHTIAADKSPIGGNLCITSHKTLADSPHESTSKESDNSAS